ncbi:hypothetical protein SEMRO_2289_G322140.1 [Seminavis robusta]|uniref:Uncharacterized protein n=1 Tax=Seminavis robusta TaxID=568900 RepID=A0A9N8EXN1_9STRA|nr:hypothetical protein SEMRO_2289_G322140.1 [Seminavis robusta]|eukprot:Sro2289_g322140.1 n/a (323) ;mRNA; f:7717-8774
MHRAISINHDVVDIMETSSEWTLRGSVEESSGNSITSNNDSQIVEGLEEEALSNDSAPDKQEDSATASHAQQDDDEDTISHDQSVSSLDSADAREKAIQDGFLAFLTGYIQNDVFSRFMEFLTNIWGFIIKKLGRGNSDGDNQEVGAEDLAEELMDIADPGLTNFNTSFNTSLQSVTGSGGGGGASGGGGACGVAPGPPPGVAEMASAAANSAASGAASGAAAGAGAATAGGLGGMAGMAGAVAGAGAATQGGIAMGVAAVTATVVSTGVTVNNVTAPVAYDFTFVPPVCSEDSVKKIGFVELQVQALPPEAIETRKLILEE